MERFLLRFNDIAAAMYDREDEILNYFVNRSTNASAESPHASPRLHQWYERVGEWL